MFHVPEDLRDTRYSTQRDGNNGVFFSGNLKIIASDGLGWEHVSVSTKTLSIPAWSTMCKVKELFWDDEDCVVQYHPPKSEYVDNHPVLHLWRPIEFTSMPRPPSHLVGILNTKNSEVRR